MKIRNSFVSNSSSSSFIITNKTSEDLDLVDFVLDNPDLINEWNDSYGYHDTQEALIDSASRNNITFPGDSSDEYIFGDEDGTLVGQVFDYILRSGGESKHFKWEFFKYYR